MGVLIVVGLVLGVLAGWRFKLMHRAFTDWRRLLASIPGARALFWRHARWSGVWIGAVLLVTILWLSRRLA